MAFVEDLPFELTHQAEAEAAEVPRLCAGVELLGRYEDSGFKDPPCIARRGDGQIVQLAPLLYALAEEVDGRRTIGEIAEGFSDRIKRGVEPAMVRELLDGQLRRLGVVAMADGQTGKVAKLDPLLALKFRTKVVPQRVVRAITTVFRPLFWPPILIVALLSFLALDVWLFGVHGISQGLRHVLYQPIYLLVLLAGVVLATASHEVGHATGVRYGGARPGVMGVGIYIVWPAFYTDITDAYRLGKWGRLRADMGGMYFNALFALAMANVYALTGFEPVLLLVVLQNFAIVQQSLPLLRLDGYYIISDLTGVPDMLSRVKPVLRSMLPNREPDDRVAELKPWVRRVVTGYVLTVIPVLAVIFVLMLAHAPRAFATGYDSVVQHTHHARLAFAHDQAGVGVMQAFQALILILPSIGLVYSVTRVARRTGPAAWRWSDDNPARRGLVIAGVVAVLGGVAYLWWPNGDYRPIQPGERGTLVSAFKSLKDLPGGRPSLTVERGLQLDADTERRAHEEQDRRDRDRTADRRAAGDDEAAGGDQDDQLPTDDTSAQDAPLTSPDSTTTPWYLQPSQQQQMSSSEPTTSGPTTAPSSTSTPTSTTPTQSSGTTSTPTSTTPTSTTETTPTSTAPTSTTTTPTETTTTPTTTTDSTTRSDTTTTTTTTTTP